MSIGVCTWCPGNIHPELYDSRVLHGLVFWVVKSMASYCVHGLTLYLLLRLTAWRGLIELAHVCTPYTILHSMAGAPLLATQTSLNDLNWT